MNSYVVPALALSPAAFECLAAKINRKNLDQPTAEGRFTPREVFAHLADWEPIFRGRLTQAAKQPGSTVAAYDEGQRAIDNNYAALDIDEQLKIFTDERETTVAFLKSLSAEDWSSQAIHPARGPFSVLEFAATIIGHDMYHVEQLTQAL